MEPMNTRKLQMVTMQKSLWLIFKLYCYFVPDVLQKNWARPEFVAGKLQIYEQ